MHRGRYIWHRTLFAIITIFVAVSLNFVLFRVLPGSAVTRISRVPNASPELKAALTKEFGLDRPIFEQYLLYLKGLFTGNLGIAYHNRQPVVAAEIAAQIAAGSRAITGVMIESHLVAGNQKWAGAEKSVYGQSITDACISFEQTEPVLEQLAAAVRERRAKA